VRLLSLPYRKLTKQTLSTDQEKMAPPNQSETVFASPITSSLSGNYSSEVARLAEKVTPDGAASVTPHNQLRVSA